MAAWAKAAVLVLSNRGWGARPCWENTLSTELRRPLPGSRRSRGQAHIHHGQSLGAQGPQLLVRADAFLH